MAQHSDLTFFSYCRKSSEDPHRQVASIRDQVDALQKIISTESLTLGLEPFAETKSAKDPGRPVFGDMLDRIERGEANALLCWDIDRLYRNPVDEGRLRWMLQKGVIKIIRTPSRTFYPEDAGLLMGVEGGRATDYVIRLSKNVKRGMASKVARGWRPGKAPIGYRNEGEVGDKYIIADPKRFAIIQKLWQHFLTGAYSVTELHELVNHQWGLRTLRRKRSGGRPLTVSHLYKIFNEPFYAGYFYWRHAETGEYQRFEGKHTAMISEDDFERGQVLLGSRRTPRPKTRLFAYTNLITCGSCRCQITAEEKHQIICTECGTKFSYLNTTACRACAVDIEEMTNPTILQYTYYHCTKRRKPRCPEPSIRLEKLEEQILAFLESIWITDTALAIALDYLKKADNAESEKQAIRASHESTRADLETRLRRLHDEYTSPQNSDYGLYTPEEFSREKALLKQQISKAERDGDSAGEQRKRIRRDTENIFTFAAHARQTFVDGDNRARRALLQGIGSNMSLMGKKLSIEAPLPYFMLQEHIKAAKAQNARFEHGIQRSPYAWNPQSQEAILCLLRVVESIRTWLGRQVPRSGEGDVRHLLLGGWEGS